MKKAFYLSAFAALSVFSACQEMGLTVNQNDIIVRKLNFTVKAGETKSYIVDNNDGTYSPKWSNGDKLAVFISDITSATSSPEYIFTNAASSGATATFTGSVVAAGSGSFLSFAPAGAFASAGNDGMVNVNVGSGSDFIQHPTKTSFDPACDILVAKECDYTAEGDDVNIDGLYFKRLLSVVKVNLKGTYAEGEKIRELTLSSTASTLSGCAKINLASAELAGEWSTAKAYACAQYTETDQMPSINDDASAVYLLVNPTTIASGSSVTVTATTENYSIEKTFTLTADMVFPAGQMAVLDLGIEESHCSAAAAAIEYVSAPTDGAAFCFDHTKAIDATALSLEWTCTGTPYYVLELSAKADMSDAYEIDLGESTSIALSNRTLGNIVSNEFSGAYKTTAVYYRVVDANGSVNTSAVKYIAFTTEFDSFCDPRDGEIYPVTKVGDDYWMAENMRAMKYYDGEAFVEVGTFYSGTYASSTNKRDGVYYAYGHALRAEYAAVGWPFLEKDSQQQGVCPDGWHVANNNDFNAMLEAAAAILGTTYTGDIFDETYYVDLSPALRFADDYTRLEDGCGYTNDLGLYFMPSGYYYPDAVVFANAPTDYYWGVAIWSATMWGWWDSYAFQSNQFNNRVFAFHYGNNSDGWSAALPVRCVKNY